MATQDAIAKLKAVPKKRDFFIGIDSDGCAFDTMEIKHKECFCPNFVEHFHLQAVSKYTRDAWDFVNLYSQWRGCNRWLAVVHVLDLLEDRKEVQRRGAKVLPAKHIRAFVDSGIVLSNDGLKEAIAKASDAEAKKELQEALDWSNAVNATIARMVHDVPPFPFVRESLEKAKNAADMIVVSQTPTEALEREWEEHSIDGYVSLIAGQELGKKSEHLKFAAGGRYTPDKILMIGDAPGDMKAAKDNHALFFPVNPGDEDTSWQRLFEEGLDRFFNGTFAGDYENNLIDEFQKLLPDTPPWKK
jgi:phosphoglycolate phosphatase-like HAD superfamily hydrolase